MWDVLINRFKQGFRTLAYPKKEPVLPKRFRGKSVLNEIKNEIPLYKENDPLNVIFKKEKTAIDMGKLMFDEHINKTFPEGVFSYSNDYKLSKTRREDLLIIEAEREKVTELNVKKKKHFGRSLKLRHVSAVGCGGCEAEINVIQIVVFDLYRFGINYVASPRHADGLIISAPVPKNMVSALRETYDDMPAPKIVIAVRSCAISGGPFACHDEVHNGVDSIIPVDIYIPGCSPDPLTILDGVLKVMK